MTPSDRDAVQFTRESAERIAGVVRTLELTPASGAPLNFDAVQSSQRKVFRMGSYTGAWARGAVNVVTLDNGSTLSASNRFCDLPSLGARSCAVAKDGTAWHLIQWQWDFDPGNDGANFAISGASLGTSSLTFSRIRVPYLGTATTVSIAVTTCSTAAS
jgi:hypothetical protein